MKMKKIVMLLVVLCFSLVIAGRAGATLIVDQRQDIVRGDISMSYAAPLGQEFVPAVSNLAAAELGIFVFKPGAGAVTLNVRKDTIYGTMVGTGSIPSAVNGWNMFDVAPDAWLTVGDRYVLEFISAYGNAANKYSGNKYDAGRAIFFGSPCGDDLQFRTYRDDTAVVPEPVSTTLFLLGGAVMAVRRLRRK